MTSMVLAAGTGGFALPHVLGLVLAAGLGWRVTVQVRRTRAVNDELAAELRATDARARALAARLASGRAQREEASVEDLDQR